MHWGTTRNGQRKKTQTCCNQRDIFQEKTPAFYGMFVAIFKGASQDKNSGWLRPVSIVGIRTWMDGIQAGSSNHDRRKPHKMHTR
jgi:hypothetical protein